MSEPNLTVRPQPDDIYVIFDILNSAYLRVRREGRGPGFKGELISGKELVAYATEVLHLNPNATTFEIARAMPSGTVFLQLVNPCATEN